MRRSLMKERSSVMLPVTVSLASIPDDSTLQRFLVQYSSFTRIPLPYYMCIYSMTTFAMPFDHQS
jgi:hypothetical protein